MYPSGVIRSSRSVNLSTGKQLCPCKTEVTVEGFRKLQCCAPIVQYEGVDEPVKNQRVCDISAIASVIRLLYSICLESESKNRPFQSECSYLTAYSKVLLSFVGAPLKIYSVDPG